MEKLSGFIESLQSQGIVCEILINLDRIWCKQRRLLGSLRGFFILPERSEYNTQIAVRSVIPRVALNHLLICLGGFIQFSSYVLVVVGGDRQPFALAGVFSQFKSFGEILARPPNLTEAEVVVA